MPSETSDIMSAFIADIEAKIAALQAILLSLKSASALGALGAAIDGIDLPSGVSPSTTGDTPIDLPEGAFNGKSLPACVKLYLSAAKRKKTLKEIAAALRDGGVESTSDDFENVVNGALFRLKNAGEVLRFKDGFGLPEWYPANIRASAPANGTKRTTKKKAKRNPRKSAINKPEPTALDTKTVPAKGTTNERVLELLRTKPEREYSLREIATHLGMGEQGARLNLGKMLKTGRVRMTAPGTYVIGKPQLMAAGD
jgi:hypothetical protein